MNLEQKAPLLQSICAIEIDATGAILPAANGALQPFANTYVKDATAKKIYFGKASVALSQDAETTRAGVRYQHKLKLRFPNADLLSAQRIQQYISVKQLFITLSGGVVYHFGRNDYFQNAPIKVAIQNTHQRVEVTYTTQSMFPLGQTNGSADHLLPEDLPINFFNL
jgi:hypothetical protein